MAAFFQHTPLDGPALSHYPPARTLSPIAVARPRIPIDASEIERLASCGLTDAQICAALSVHSETLRRRKRDSVEFAAALTRGRARGTAAVASALYDKAITGDLKAQMFFLKTRAGWTEPDSRPFAVSPFEKEDVLRDMQAKAINRQVGLYLQHHGANL